MSVTQFLFLLSMMGSGTAPMSGVDFPAAPRILEQAEAQGLHRLNAAELKAFFPAALDGKYISGKGPQSLQPGRPGLRRVSSDEPGTWRIDETSHTYCNRFSRTRGAEESCFTVFRASAGPHYFGYDAKTGIYTYGWRRYQGV